MAGCALHRVLTLSVLIINIVMYICTRCYIDYCFVQTTLLKKAPPVRLAEDVLPDHVESEQLELLDVVQ